MNFDLWQLPRIFGSEKEKERQFQLQPSFVTTALGFV